MLWSTKFKHFFLVTGLYRPARWLWRLAHRGQSQTFSADIALYKSLISTNGLCFDVGANVGEKSAAMLRAGARVVAFEPHPLVIPELRARCGHDRNWTLVEAALGARASVATLYAREASTHTSLSPDWDGKTIATFTVPVMTLDSAIEQFGVPSYCKIDVEGWELAVLEGLSKPMPLLSFEFHLHSDDVQKTLACLERLSGLEAVSSEVNITAMEQSEFYFDEWMPLSQFREWFPGDLSRDLDYGNIFVRSH